MSSDNPTNRLPDDKLDRLIVLAEDTSTRLGLVEQRLSSLENKVDAIDRRLTSLESKVNKLESKVDKLDERLSSLETTVDNRLKETRPIWEAFEDRLERVESSLDRVRAISHELKADFRDWRKSVNARLEKLEPRVS